MIGSPTPPLGLRGSTHTLLVDFSPLPRQDYEVSLHAERCGRQDHLSPPGAASRRQHQPLIPHPIFFFRGPSSQPLCIQPRAGTMENSPLPASPSSHGWFGSASGFPSLSPIGHPRKGERHLSILPGYSACPPNLGRDTSNIDAGSKRGSASAGVCTEYSARSADAPVTHAGQKWVNGAGCRDPEWWMMTYVTPPFPAKISCFWSLWE